MQMVLCTPLLKLFNIQIMFASVKHLPNSNSLSCNAYKKIAIFDNLKDEAGNLTGARSGLRIDGPHVNTSWSVG